MKIYIQSKDNGLTKACQDIGRLFFPAAEYQPTITEETNLVVEIETSLENEEARAKVTLKEGERILKNEQMEKVTPGAEDYNQEKRVAKLAFLKLMEEFSGQKSGPWGILTGIRPTKIVHRLIDANWQEADIKNHLLNGYALSSEKAALLLEIAHKEREHLLDEEEAKKLVSIYIGIPFCPTRCAYCSFPAYSIEQNSQLVEPFLKALISEIEFIGKYIKTKNLEVQTIYIGGGTPTSLQAEELDYLLKSINEHLHSNATIEFTVEAGRPDTITKEKLQIIKEAGVNRTSINPQSMHPETLVAIGRNHQPWDVTDAVDLAREVGIDIINMDLIVGLPGETIDHIRETMRYVGMMSPENITLHTLAVKRASGIKEKRADFNLPSQEIVEGMFDSAIYNTRTMAMEPYYMYRQKQMVGPLENIGFALKGYECIYNIQMIEERQTIIGLGAGAGSKFVKPGEWTLESFYNPKDPQNYIDRIDELCSKKASELDNVFQG